MAFFVQVRIVLAFFHFFIFFFMIYSIPDIPRFLDFVGYPKIGAPLFLGWKEGLL